jgi:putative flippase GtrA
LGAFKRFFLVAISGFAMNECLLSMFLISGLFPPAGSLLAATLIVALSNFFLSKKWAFRA